MKKIIALLLIAVMALSLAACGGNSGGKESGNKDNSSQAQTGESSGASDPGTDSSTHGGDSYDLSTVEGFLAQYSYTVDDFKFTKDFSKVEYVSRAVRSDNSYEPELFTE